jgi:hypothetical protein
MDSNSYLLLINLNATMGQLESGTNSDVDSSKEKSGAGEIEKAQQTESNTNDEKYNKAISSKEAILKALKKKGKSKPSDTAPRIPAGICHAKHHY